MSGFSYPKPFEFENENVNEEDKHDGKNKEAAKRRAPSRSKSNEESFFSAGTFVASTPRRLGPKTKSGRHLPKPAPSIPIRGRNPPAHRSVGKTQSSNLEQMQAGTRTRSLSVPKSKRLPVVTGKDKEEEDDNDDEEEDDSYPEKKPSSLKNFLTLKKKDTRDDELKGSLHSLQTSKSCDSQKSASSTFKFLRRKSVSTPTKDNDVEPVDHEPTKARSKTSSTGRHRKSYTKDVEEDSSSRRDKTKSFKQLLAKKHPHASSNKRDVEGPPGDKNRRGRGGGRAVSPSPARCSPEREPSLSPVEVKKPGSLLTNLLDTLYDSYIDPKVKDDDDSEELGNLQSSVSRFDMSLSSLF